MQVIPQLARNTRTFNWKLSRLACLLPRAEFVPRLQKYIHVSGVCHVEILGKVRDEFTLLTLENRWGPGYKRLEIVST